MTKDMRTTELKAHSYGTSSLTPRGISYEISYEYDECDVWSREIVNPSNPGGELLSKKLLFGGLSATYICSYI